MTYEIEVTDHFSSAHRLRDQGSACERMHGHNWFVTVTLRSETLDDIGLVIDFKVVKKHLKEILGVLDHQDLNAIPPFDTINPSTENLARHIFEQMSGRLAGAAVGVHRVRVSEGPNTAASFYGGA